MMTFLFLLTLSAYIYLFVKNRGLRKINSLSDKKIQSLEIRSANLLASERESAERLEKIEKVKQNIANLKSNVTVMYDLGRINMDETSKALELEKSRLSEGQVRESELRAEVAALKKYQPILDIEKQIELSRDEAGILYQNILKLRSQITALQEELAPLELDKLTKEFGLYEPKYDLSSSTIYKLRLDEIRAKQKNLIKQERAVLTPTNWTINGSQREGAKMTRPPAKVRRYSG